MPKPTLPVDLIKGDVTRTATTPAEYVDLTFHGFLPVTDASEDDLSPQQKAARTRAANRAQDAVETSNVATSTPVPAGNAS